MGGVGDGDAGARRAADGVPVNLCSAVMYGEGAVTEKTYKTFVVTEFSQIARSVLLARATFRERADLARLATEAAETRLAVAASALDDQRRWAAEQVSAVAGAVADGAAQLPSDVERNIIPPPAAALLPDARRGLLAAGEKARMSRDEIQAGKSTVAGPAGAPDEDRSWPGFRRAGSAVAGRGVHCLTRLRRKE